LVRGRQVAAAGKRADAVSSFGLATHQETGDEKKKPGPIHWC